MEMKYEAVIHYIEKLISNNSLKQGQRLPSIRMMAQKLNCNKGTVIRAYEELEAEHRIYSIPKSGYFLVENIRQGYDDYGLIDFQQVMPDPRLLPYKEFNHCINKAVELYRDNMFLYSDAQGLESLRRVLVEHFTQYQIFTTVEDIFITSGAQQALSILAQMSFPNKKRTILVEQPTYSLMQRFVELKGYRMLGIKRNHDGVDLNELEGLFKNEDIKFFYVIPRFQNPLGSSYSEKEKRKIVELAEKYDVYIVEDDYLADIDTNKKAFPMFYYDISKKVVYLKSFSKTFMPGIRIGSVVLHERLRNEFLKHKRYYDLNTSVLAQGALEIFINSGMYKNHVRKVQSQYKEKMNFLREYLKGLDSRGAEYIVPETGFFLWLKIPEKVNANNLRQRLLKRNIHVSQGNEFFINSKPVENTLRLCISKLSREEIKRGIRIVFDEIQR